MSRYTKQTKRLPVIKEETSPPKPSGSKGPSKPVQKVAKAWSQGPPRSVTSSQRFSDAKVHIPPPQHPVVQSVPEPAAQPKGPDPSLLPWPESDDYDLYQTPEPQPPRLTDERVQSIGDKIVDLIGSEVEMCRGLPVKIPKTHIRLYPSPPYERALNIYVIEKAKERSLVDVHWAYGRDDFTIIF
jgi:hypothetical protein